MYTGTVEIQIDVGPPAPHVLVAEDSERLADLFRIQLPSDYHVEVVHDGQAALAAIDEQTDVLLLDRRMPGCSGDDVLAEIRQRRLDCRVVLVSAVDPDVATMQFDDYLCKPVGARDLRRVVEQQLERRERERHLDEFLRLQSKILLLETQKHPSELRNSDRYRRLTDHAAALEAVVEDGVDDFEMVRQRLDAIDRAV